MSSNDKDVETNLNGDEPPPPRITFHSSSAEPRGRPQRLASRQRSSSRDSNCSGRSGRNSLPGIPIQFRTLSIQVAESQTINHDLGLHSEKHPTTKAHDDTDYFEKLNFHSLSPDLICQQFNVNQSVGLGADAASHRLQRDGKNTIPRRRENYLRKVLGYVFGGFCSVLWVGVLIFFLCWRPLGSPPAPYNLALAILVLIVIFLQATFSAFQDWSTKRVMNSILALLPLEALVLRDGQMTRIPAADLVAGDIVQISIGNKVPADLRLLGSSGDIRFDRSVLTGESEEVEGSLDPTDDNFLETRNIALMGTNVANGNGSGIVVLTGSRTVMGRIASATSGLKEKPTLIQREITRFVRIIIGLTLCLALLILFTWVGWLRVDHFGYMNVVAMLNDVMGCVVAFIPEGMPIGVALTLMMIARRMKNVKILPKGLSTVETLGCVTVLCSDKTGTLTENKMKVATVGFCDGECGTDEFIANMSQLEPPRAIQEMHRASSLCNDASFDPLSAHLPVLERNVHGNATDGSILKFAESVQEGAGVRASFPKVYQIPFNSQNKWMLTLHRGPDTLDCAEGKQSRYQAYIKGAPDVLLPRCARYWSAQSNSIHPLDEAIRARLCVLQERLSKNAERVILFCEQTCAPLASLGSNQFGDEVASSCSQDLIIIGMLGITDPPRAETAQTVASCRRAGIRFMMVTGDFGLTATAVARRVGIFTSSADPDRVQDLANPNESRDVVTDHREMKSLLLEGTHIGKLNQDDWNAVCSYGEIVFARTTPEQKLRIVNEFKARDNVVAVTGDGVNDAPALRAADVGVAMGSGSDVAIEAADLVLLDKFDSIVDAIRLGRLAFENLQKLISYLLPAGSWSEIWPVLLNVFIGVPLPLSSFLMIIICVFTDLFLCLTLIMEKEEFDLLDLPPRDHKKHHLINLKIYVQSYLFIGVMETVCAHSMFFFYMYKAAGIPFHALIFAFEAYQEGFYGYSAAELSHFNSVGQCVYFVTLVILQWGNILAIRNKRLSIVQADPIRKKRRNPWLPLGAAISLVIAVFVTEVPGMQTLFGTASVPIEFWLLPLPLALGILIMDEMRKVMVREFPRGPLAKIAW